MHRQSPRAATAPRPNTRRDAGGTAHLAYAMLFWSLQVRDRTADRMSYQEHAMSTRLIARVPAAAVAASPFMSEAPRLAQVAAPALIGKLTPARGWSLH